VTVLPYLLAACAGFLIAVLWMDLMFDVQGLGGDGSVPEPALASIAAYYRRVTTDAGAMSALIAGVMITAVAGALLAAVRTPGVGSIAALLAIALPVGLALLRIVPNAVRLGQRADAIAVQEQLARRIAREHLLCLAAVIVFLLLQLTAASGR
jgi:hypothetical protein